LETKQGPSKIGLVIKLLLVAAALPTSQQAIGTSGSTMHAPNRRRGGGRGWRESRAAGGGTRQKMSAADGSRVLRPAVHLEHANLVYNSCAKLKFVRGQILAE